MRVFKATYKDRKGKTRESAKWYVEFRDHLETVRRLPAFKDKKQSEAAGRNIEKLVASKINGDPPDKELGRWLEALPKAMRGKLCAIGLLDATSATAGKKLLDHIADFEGALLAKGDVERHARAVAQHTKRVVEGCGFQFWHELSAAKVQRFLAKLRDDDDLSLQTVNNHLQHTQQFCRWMVRERRANESPIAHLQRQNVATDRRHDRRELAADECLRLLRAAHNGRRVEGVDGPERALIYRLALESGLRANELHSLTRASFEFRTAPATVSGEAGSSKRRRLDTLPLRVDTAAVLQAHFANKLPTGKRSEYPRATRRPT